MGNNKDIEMTREVTPTHSNSAAFPPLLRDS